jgi:hypothetical protein
VVLDEADAVKTKADVGVGCGPGDRPTPLGGGRSVVLDEADAVKTKADVGVGCGPGDRPTPLG